MSESESERRYDPEWDPDADPGQVNPRSGAQASGDPSQDADTDAEPANLNPRDDTGGDEPTGEDY